MDNVPPLPPPSSLPPSGPYPSYYGQPPLPRQPGWFARNWLWFVPVGCLGVLAVLAAFAGGIAMLVFGMMKASDPYKVALARAQNDPQVTAALGTPIKEPFYLTGQINSSGSTGNANLAIPLSGPKDKGTLYVVATKSGGEWKYSVMRVHIDGSSKNVDLLDQER